jgi:uncharacterized protein
MTPMRVAIAGASGLIGTAVTDHLRKSGHEVTRLVRHSDATAQSDAVYWRPDSGEIDADALAGHQIIINLAGENIFGAWTPAKKRRIRESRLEGTTLLASTIERMADSHRPDLFIVASAVGFYGDRPWTEPLGEDSPPGDSFLARVLVDMEAAAATVERLGVRLVIPRFAPVVDPAAVLLRGIAMATRFGLGAALGPGGQPFPWVTLADVAGVVALAMARTDMQGPVNVVAPDHVTNAEFVDAVARVLNRPRFLRVPTPVVKLAGDLGKELLVGQLVVPGKLKSAGYEWQDPELDRALRRMLLK